MRTAKENRPAAEERLAVIRHIPEAVPHDAGYARFATHPRKWSLEHYRRAPRIATTMKATMNAAATQRQ